MRMNAAFMRAELAREPHVGGEREREAAAAGRAVHAGDERPAARAASASRSSLMWRWPRSAPAETPPPCEGASP